jgi:hypothetical protein
VSITNGSSSATIPVASSSVSGLMIPTDKAKLDTYPTISNTPTSGQVLASNGDGTATWTTSSGGSGGSSTSIYHALDKAGSTSVADVLAKGSGGKIKFWIDNSGSYSVFNISIPSGVILDYVRIHVAQNGINDYDQMKVIVKIIDESGATNNNYQDALMPYVFGYILNDNSPALAAPWVCTYGDMGLQATSESIGSGTLALTINNFNVTGGGGAFLILNY